MEPDVLARQAGQAARKRVFECRNRFCMDALDSDDAMRRDRKIHRDGETAQRRFGMLLERVDVVGENRLALGGIHDDRARGA